MRAKHDRQAFYVILALACIMGLIAFWFWFASYADAHHFPEAVAFLHETVLQTSGMCVHTETGVQRHCDVTLDEKTGDRYMVVWTQDRKAVHEVWKWDAKLNQIQKVYSAEAECRSERCS